MIIVTMDEPTLYDGRNLVDLPIRTHKDIIGIVKSVFPDKTVGVYLNSVFYEFLDSLGLSINEFELYCSPFNKRKNEVLIKRKILKMNKGTQALYTERSYLISHLASLYPCSLETAKDCENDPDFNWIIYIDLPTGQVSWHIADDDLDLFDFVERNDGREWDKHNFQEKYKRLHNLTLGNIHA